MHWKFIFLYVFGENIRWLDRVIFLAECINFVAKYKVLYCDLFAGVLLDKAHSIVRNSNDEFWGFTCHVFDEVLDFSWMIGLLPEILFLNVLDKKWDIVFLFRLALTDF
jgi:hypothetical protein